jgi:putative ABC transport system substrate-binding protein
MRKVFVAAMSEHGRSEGRHFVILQSGYAEAGSDLEPAGRRMLEQNPDLILTQGTATALAAHRLTSTIPIVMWTSGYPVEAGLAHSLARPGKNVTGNAFYAGARVWGKMVELLREAKPGIKRVGALWGYSPPRFLRAEIDPGFEEIRQAARALDLAAPVFAEYSSPAEVPAALSRLAAEGVDGLIVASRSSLGRARVDAMRFAIDRRWPTVADFRWPAADDPRPLMGYGASLELLMRQAAFYVDRIMKGANAAELPIQLPARIALTVSARTAKAMGLALPRSLLLRADEVIE